MLDLSFGFRGCLGTFGFSLGTLFFRGLVFFLETATTSSLAATTGTIAEFFFLAFDRDQVDSIVKLGCFVSMIDSKALMDVLLFVVV
jgi:hypothetical protein